MCEALCVFNQYISCIFFHLQRVISSVNDSRRALLESDRSYKNHSLQANVQNGPAPPGSPATKTTFVAFIALDASHESTRASSLRRETGLTRHAFLFTTSRNNQRSLALAHRRYSLRRLSSYPRHPSPPQRGQGSRI